MTHTQTEAMILAALDDTQPGQFVAWAPIRDTLPPGVMHRLCAFVALVERGEIDVVKVRGRNFIARPDVFSVAARAASGRSSVLVA